MTETWTVEKILKWTTNFFAEKELDSPKLDAELLLAHVLGIDRIKLYMQWDRPLEVEELASYRALIKRRVQDEPLAYITGSKAFWNLDFKSDKRALIPRSDTETLIETALELIPDPKKVEGAPQVRIVDVGAGTGCIGITIAHERPNTHVTLVDIDPDALQLAQENVELHKMQDRVTCLQSDLLESAPGPWDLIVSNPPYVALTEKGLMGRDVLAHEPPLALFAGEDGLDVIRRLLEQAFVSIAPEGHVLCEVGFAQGPAVKELMESLGFENVQIRKDYGSNDRVVVGQRVVKLNTHNLNSCEV